MDEQPDSYRWLLGFFLAMTEDDVYQMEKIEDKITGIEDGILSRDRRKDDGLGKIITMRRGLLKLKRYYEQLSLVTSCLAADEEGDLPEGMQQRLAAFDRRVDHLRGSGMHLREAVTQVREAYQAQIDISQNQTMKVLTVVSAVFLPLTLIVGWFGMNLQMPEYSWEFGYLYVIVLSAIVCFFCLAVLKLKKWY
jgi:magnesium transporter